jgi:type IV pilus assembly protein PilA
MNNTKNKRLNNGGFSLVELIIVIAIMAVLVGVLAPQYLKYVEKSRQSADISSVDELLSAIEIYSADPSNDVVNGTITCTAGALTISSTAVTGYSTIGDALSEAGVTSSALKIKSKAYQNWIITVNDTGISFTGADGDDLQTALGR